MFIPFGNALKRVKGKVSNPLILLLLGFFDVLLVAVYGASSEKGQFFWKIVAQLVLNFEPIMRAEAADTATELDDKAVSELIQAAKEIVPGFVPIDWPG